jgi:hypothetical protein
MLGVLAQLAGPATIIRASASRPASLMRTRTTSIGRLPMHGVAVASGQPPALRLERMLAARITSRLRQAMPPV